MQLPIDWDAVEEPRALTVAPSPFPQARETSAIAAVAAQATRATKATRLLDLVRAAGPAGLSDPEIARATGWPRSTVCSVRNAVRSRLRPTGERRASEWGQPCTCWRLATTEETSWPA